MTMTVHAKFQKGNLHLKKDAPPAYKRTAL